MYSPIFLTYFNIYCAIYDDNVTVSLNLSIRFSVH